MKKLLILPAIISLGFLLWLDPTYAQTSTDITLQVDVSVCGNAQIETPSEDCENLDLNAQSCTTLGYPGGLLSCDQACSFDTSACHSPAPSPLPSSIPPTSNTTNSSPNASSSPLSPTPTPVPLVATLTRLPRTIRLLLSTSLAPDLDNFSSTYLRPVLQNWVTSWQSLTQANLDSPPAQPLAACDINEDTQCNLTDLSVLLFYVQP